LDQRATFPRDVVSRVNRNGAIVHEVWLAALRMVGAEANDHCRQQGKER
jgi:hypothetical protein